MPEAQRRRAFVSIRMTEGMRADINKAREIMHDQYGDPVTLSRAVQILIQLGLEGLNGGPEPG